MNHLSKALCTSTAGSETPALPVTTQGGGFGGPSGTYSSSLCPVGGPLTALAASLSSPLSSPAWQHAGPDSPHCPSFGLSPMLSPQPGRPLAMLSLRLLTNLGFDVPSFRKPLSPKAGCLLLLNAPPAPSNDPALARPTPSLTNSRLLEGRSGAWVNRVLLVTSSVLGVHYVLHKLSVE